MFNVKILFQCENCNNENDISDINGTCGNCDNNNFENFEIIMPKGALKGMSGMNALSTAGEMLKSALNKAEVLIIDPEDSYNNL